MGRQRTHTPVPIVALALGVVLVFATVSTASAGQRGTTHGDHATSGAGLLSVTGRLSAVAETHGVAWAVGYVGTAENGKALTLYWNGHRWQREANPSPSGADLSGWPPLSHRRLGGRHRRLRTEPHQDVDPALEREEVGGDAGYPRQSYWGRRHLAHQRLGRRVYE